MKPTLRLARRVRTDFGGHSQAVLAELATIPETLPLADKQDPERLQAAVVLSARGSIERVATSLARARTDWRDALMAGGLANGDWRQRLDRELGPE